MHIRDATLALLNHERESKGSAFLRKGDRADAFTLYVAAGSVYRFAEPHPQAGTEVGLDVRDCLGDDWFVIGEDDQVLAGP